MQLGELFLEEGQWARSALTAHISPDGRISFQLLPCSGWGILIEGLSAQGERITLFCKESELSEVVQKKIGAPDLFALPPEWIPVIMRQLLKPFEDLFEEKISWKSFYPEKRPFKYCPSFRWHAQEGQNSFQLFSLKLPVEWVEHFIREWERDLKATLMPQDSNPVPLWLCLGKSWVAQDQLQILSVGDGISLQLAAPGGECCAKAWLVWGQPLFLVEWGEEDKTLEVLDMIEEDEWNETRTGACYGLEAPVELSAMVGEVSLSLSQLSQLVQGEVISEGVHLYEKILLLANGVPFAFGELLESEGVWMVRVTQKLPQQETAKAEQDLSLQEGTICTLSPQEEPKQEEPQQEELQQESPEPPQQASEMGEQETMAEKAAPSPSDQRDDPEQKEKLSDHAFQIQEQ